MSEALWNVECRMILSREHHFEFLQICRRRWTNVDDDIQNASTRASDNFRFLEGSDLKMKAAQRSAAVRYRNTTLIDRVSKPGVPHFLRAPGPSKEASTVALNVDVDAKDAGKANREDLHLAESHAWDRRDESPSPITNMRHLRDDLVSQVPGEN